MGPVARLHNCCTRQLLVSSKSFSVEKITIYGDPTHHCVCTPGQIQRYMNKTSGPLLDRIDIHCEIQAVPFTELSKMAPGELFPSEVCRYLAPFAGFPLDDGILPGVCL